MVANEGDPRNTDLFSEKVRVGDLPLDPVAFPDAAALQRPEALGRLQVTKVEGDPDGDGDVDRLVLLARDRGRTYAFVAFEGTGGMDGVRRDQPASRQLPAGLQRAQLRYRS